MFRNVADVIPMWVQYCISICLLEADEQVQHLYLSLYDYSRLGQYVSRGMIGSEDGIGIFRNVDGCD